MYSFALNRDLGEVVFTLRLAYQAINTKLEPNPPGSYYNDICTFVSDIVTERTKHAEHIRAERARKQQERRQERQDARDAAEALKKLQKAKPKVFFFIASLRGLTFLDLLGQKGSSKFVQYCRSL